MAIEKMELVSFTGKVNKLNKIIAKCLLSGDFHIEQASEYIGFADMVNLITKTKNQEIHIEDLLAYSSSSGKFNSSQAIQYISSVLGYNVSGGENPYSGILQSIKELEADFGYDIESDSEKYENAEIDEDFNEYIISIGDKVKRLNDERKQLLEQKKKCEEGVAQFSHFTGFDVPLEEIMNSEFVAVRFGHMPKESTEKLQLAYSDNPYILFVPCTNEGEECWGAYVSPKDKRREIDKIFSALHFERLWIPEAVGSTDEIIENLNKNIEMISESLKECDEEINNIFLVEKDRLKSLYFKLMNKSAIYDIRKYVFVLGGNFYCVGWVPAKKVKKLTSRLQSFNGTEVQICKADEVANHEPPVMLKNPRFIRPYEYYVNMYGLPNYKDMDITFFVAIVYTLVFGVMFGDVGQGLLLAIGGFLAWKLKKIELGKILVPCGVASMVCGFVFGSVFGFEEALDPVYKAIGLGHKPVEVMESINGVLLFAIGIGVALVISAMVLNIIISLKRKKVGEALFSENGLTGILFYCCGACAIYSFMGGPNLIPTKLLIPLMVAAILILFNKEILIGIVDKHENWKPTSVSDYILQNLFECLEYVLSYFSNTLSFLRVGAFVIVHASMMMVVFTLAGDTSSVKGIIVVILGNIVVIALEGLLTGIQSLRLIFYEMFSRFHEGGGKPFTGFKLTKKTNK